MIISDDPSPYDSRNIRDKMQSRACRMRNASLHSLYSLVGQSEEGARGMKSHILHSNSPTVHDVCTSISNTLTDGWYRSVSRFPSMEHGLIWMSHHRSVQMKIILSSSMIQIILILNLFVVPLLVPMLIGIFLLIKLKLSTIMDSLVTLLIFDLFNSSFQGSILATKTVCMRAVQGRGGLRLYNTHNLYGWSESRTTQKAVYEATGKRGVVISRLGITETPQRIPRRLDRRILHLVVMLVIGWEIIRQHGKIWEVLSLERRLDIYHYIHYIFTFIVIPGIQSVRYSVRWFWCVRIQWRCEWRNVSEMATTRIFPLFLPVCYLSYPLTSSLFQ